MAGHPENSPEVNRVIEEIAKADTCQVWCKTCKDWRTMNAAYAVIIKTGEIVHCSMQCKRLFGYGLDTPHVLSKNKNTSRFLGIRCLK